MPSAVIPDPALVVLVGPSGSGKSTWAAARYRTAEIVSSDQLRGVVGSGEHDLDASADAFALLDAIVAARLRRGLTTVVDTLGFDAERRRDQRELARRAGLPAVAVLFGTDAAECRRRNRLRTRPVPAAVLDAQLRRVPDALAQLAEEGWLVIESADDLAVEPSHSAGSRSAAAEQRDRPAELGIVLQISRFPWGDDPAAWLTSVAAAAAEAGLTGLALMDHLIQIPQVGRAWEPIPEPWVTLGLLAGLGLDLTLGTLVTPAMYRAPGVLAKTAATVDVLSGGRAFCGVGAGWWEREHAGFGLPFPPAGERLDRLDLLDRKLPVLRSACELADRDAAEVAVTVLDVPVIGRDRDHVGALVEQLRGRTSAAAFARSHHAGTASDHIGRYRLLAERGVSTMFVSLPDLTGPDDIARLSPLAEAFT